MRPGPHTTIWLKTNAALNTNLYQNTAELYHCSQAALGLKWQPTLLIAHGRMHIDRQGTSHAPCWPRPLHVPISFGISVWSSWYVFDILQEWLSECNLLALTDDVRCFSFYGQIFVWSKWVSKIGARWLATVHQRHFFPRSMCTLRETNYWHEMWPTQLDLSQPPKIGWSRSHHMMIKILWYVDLLSFRPNSLTWSTNLEKHYFWVLKGNTTFNLVQGGTEVGGTEGVKGSSRARAC